MIQYTHYFGRFNDLRGGLGGLPQWARFIVGVAALPGVVLLGLSFVALAVSLLALLLLTAPVYALLRAMTARRRPLDEVHSGVRRVETTVIE